ncbi:unnamed protein product [Timema podura]|uniref:Uncharacterized protein n=1 Tax=Timema podura TaxID=61482 RepID=A0ABN7PA34_TIMPD|nr:unnamed protein product [Timema podura]
MKIPQTSLSEGECGLGRPYGAERTKPRLSTSAAQPSQFMFMGAGGWNLTHVWLSDAIMAKNWPLIQELLELLLICPVDVERLKTNSCPKLIKGLSRESVQ